MARPIKNDSNDVVQSYMLTTAKYDFTIHEKRILYRLVELAQGEIKGKLKELVGMRLDTNLVGDKEITMALKLVLPHDEYKNYEVAKKAFRSIAKKTIERTQGNVWYLDHMLERVKVDMGTGIARFRVSPDVWNIILDFTKGYRKYELITTMQFKSVYSMRFYELMSGQKDPLTYSLDELRRVLCIENKFKRIGDLEKDVLDTAADELHKYSPYAFTYERNTIPSRGRCGEKVVGYTFYPVYIPKNDKAPKQEKSLQTQISVSSLLSPEIYNYLIGKGFTKEHLSKNKDTLCKFCELSPDPMGQIAIAIGRARGKSNEVGYFINTLKGMIKDLK